MVSTTEIATGIVRLAWETGTTREEVSEVIALAFDSGAHRVEAHLHVADVAEQRLAAYAGLRREGVARGVDEGQDRIVYARLVNDAPPTEPEGFRALLNSFLPRKRAISQLLIRDESDRVLLCQLTYKTDWDLPGGVVEVGESPQVGVSREVEEELGLRVDAGPLLLTDWLPPWGGWDDALCLVFDGGSHPHELLETLVADRREIRDAQFCTLEEVEQRCADFTARRIHSALANLAGGPSYVEGGG